MTSDLAQVDAFITPGTLLRRARLLQGLSTCEVEEQLNLVAGYVAVLERDDYQALRSPAFARGYVRAYGQLLKLDEAVLLRAFDEQRDNWDEEKRQVRTGALQLQKTGLGVVVGLAILLLLFAVLWWWQRGREGTDIQPLAGAESEYSVDGSTAPAGEQ